MMNITALNASSILEQVTMSMLMDCLGRRPVKSIGNEEVYFNLLGDTEATPTFVVNKDLNVWYDQLTKKGGNLIDFGLYYWPGLERDQVVEKIIATIVNHQPKQDHNYINTKKRKRKAIKLPYYQIEVVKPIGCNPDITSYLVSQGLWEMAIGHMKEVYYYFLDEKRRRKDFFAAGWQNENGGWEVRSKNYSGCLGNKGITYIPNNDIQLIIFNDFYSYLNWKFANKISKSSALIINYPEFMPVANKRASKFMEVIHYSEVSPS